MAWKRWDAKPRREETTNALEDAVQAQARQSGISANYLREAMAEERRAGVEYQVALDLILEREGGRP